LYAHSLRKPRTETTQQTAGRMEFRGFPANFCHLLPILHTQPFCAPVSPLMATRPWPWRPSGCRPSLHHPTSETIHSWMSLDEDSHNGFRALLKSVALVATWPLLWQPFYCTRQQKSKSPLSQRSRNGKVKTVKAQSRITKGISLTFWNS
jgi:hypothetical protein